MRVKVMKFSPDAIIPKYQHSGDAGLDICSTVDIVIPKGSYRLVSTGIGLDIPKGYEVQLRARSGLAAKYGIGLVNGVGTIDSGYKGEIKVALYNMGESDFKIERGMRIAQIIFAKYQHVRLVETGSLSSSDRGQAGFGSSGVK